MSSPSMSLVAASDIAELAGVSRAAVSNWRQRHDDFPPQVAGTKTKPLYAVPDVTTWLAKQGYTVNQVPAGAKVWAALNTLRGRYTPDQAATIVIALISERAMGDNAPATLALSRQMSSPNTDQNLTDQVRAEIDSVDESELASVVDFVLERTARANGRMGAEHGFIGSRTSHILASVAANRPGGVVYDPACGIATALLKLAKTGGFDSYIGHEMNEYALAVAEVRAALHGVPLHLEEADVVRADPDPYLRADVIIAEPPFGVHMDFDTRLTDPRFIFGVPPKGSTETAWIQHAIAHLTENGRAFVITSQGQLFSGGAAERIRAELLRQGCVETVVGLPGRMLPHTAIPLALWVLRRPNDEHSDVLLIDASKDEAAEKHVARWLSDASALATVPHVRVSVNDLVNDESKLNPQRWLATDEPSADEVHADFASATTAIREAIQTLGGASGRIAFTTNAPSRTLTVGELIREGVLQRGRSRASRNASDELKAAMVGARAITSKTLPDPLAADLIEDGMELTRPSDILVLAQTGIRALVDDDGGHLLSPVVEQIRVLKPEVVDPHYLAAVISGTWNTRFLVGTTIQRAKLTDLEIPLVPMDDQQRLVAALTEVEHLRHTAQTIAEAGEALSASLLDAVRLNITLDAALKR
ncbi:hypothetical protein ABIE38_001393 [Dietzia sp. 2505]|uniref:N-6 DNA methylase n=1 Tax=Dietzia sp. 2505 TaxID=3156457 RepID=UPI003390FCC8